MHFRSREIALGLAVAVALLLAPVAMGHSHGACHHGGCGPAAAAGPNCCGQCELQSLMAAAGVRVERSNLDQGVRMTVTSDDPAMVGRIQAATAACEQRHAEGNCPGCRSIAMKVEKIDNGVAITRTSGDSRWANQLRHGGGCCGR